MKRNLSILLILIFSALLNHQSFAQQINPCYTDQATREAIKNNPDAAIRREQLEKFTEEYTKQVNQSGSANKVQGTVYVVPVVFHVLHTWGSENITDDQIYDEMRILNRDYRKLNADTANVVPSFQGIIADVEFEFRLAHKDPNGNCTNGINRYYNTNTDWVQGTTPYQYTGTGSGQWAPTKYLNIYVVKSIMGGGGNVAAYTYVPGTWPTNNFHDAIVTLSDFVGSIGTGSTYNSRTLTHEIGHWFNLYHPWGTTNQPGVSCGGTDGVGDTPETIGSIVGVCNLTLSVCNPPVIENVQNYMDYSYCDVMFTEGQKTRMRAAITSSTSGRNNLWTTANLTATGTDGATYTCIPTPYLNNALRTLCEGSSTTFSHNTLNLDTASATTYLWTFPGGTPGTSNLENPTITYNTAGHYDVTLSVTNTAGTNSVTYPLMVSVYSTLASQFVPFSEGFETITFPGTDYDVYNLAQNGWAQTSNAAASGFQSIYINNWGGNSGTDVFVTPSYNFSSVSAVTMTFKVAFAMRNAASTDKLQVYGSTNCGQTWSQRYVKSGSILATTTSINNFSSFTPSASQWRQESVLASVYSNQPNVRFKFVYTYSSGGNYGNNIYVDDININGTVGINEQFADQIAMSLSPNPTDKAANLNFVLTQPGNVEINVRDVVGRTCSTLKAGHLQPGEHNYSIGSNLSSGIYFVELINDGNKALRKLVIE
ncbi:MAG: M43 family zinc metalloprotease [Bacteroidia bacterium]